MAVVDFISCQIGIIKDSYLTYGTLAQNEACFVQMTIKNNSSKAISKITYYMLHGDNYAASILTMVENVRPGYTITGTASGQSLKPGDSASLKSNIYTYMNSQTPKIRSLLINKLYVVVVFSDKTQYTTYLTPPDFAGDITILNARCNPIIQNLAFYRCDANGVKKDEGEYALTTLKTSFASESYKDWFGITLKQYNTNTSTLVQTISIDSGDAILSQLYTGVTDSNLFINSFSLFAKEVNYKVVVEIGDEFEKSTLSYSIPATFVNIHLSAASKGGVAFGKLSSAEDNNPLFECDYPAHFYDNVKIIGSGGIDNLKYGIVTTDLQSLVAPGGQREVTINFDHAFTGTPVVTVCAYSSMQEYNISCCLKSVSTSGFTVVGTNNGSSITTIGFNWIAYGQL